MASQYDKETRANKSKHAKYKKYFASNQEKVELLSKDYVAKTKKELKNLRKSMRKKSKQSAPGSVIKTTESSTNSSNRSASSFQSRVHSLTSESQ